jgi:hypothetical protein
VALLLAALPLAIIGLCRATRNDRPRVLAAFLLALSIVFPVAYAIAIKAVLFDGMRHFIFVLPPIAVAAALVGDRALARLAHFRYRGPVYAGLALYAAAHVAIMVMLHPDQYVYYNAFVGGVQGAERRFKLDYWANSYAEDVHMLVSYLQSEYGAKFGAHQFTVGVCGPPISAVYFFPPNLHFMKQPEKADFFVAFTKDNCDRSLPGKTIYRTERMGALLSVVLDRRAVLAERRVTEAPATRATAHSGGLAPVEPAGPQPE